MARTTTHLPPTYVDAPDFAGVVRGGDSALLKATHTRDARRRHLETKTRETNYRYVDTLGALHHVDGPDHHRTGLCSGCDRWFRVTRPTAIDNRRWHLRCSPECDKRHDTARKRRQRAGEGGWTVTEFNPSDWLDPEYVARLLCREPYEPDIYGHGSTFGADPWLTTETDEHFSGLGTRFRRTVSPDAKAQAAAYLESLIDDYDRCQRALPVEVDQWREHSVFDIPGTDIVGTVIFEPVVADQVSSKPLYDGDGIPEDMPEHIRQRMEANIARGRRQTRQRIDNMRRRRGEAPPPSSAESPE